MKRETSARVDHGRRGFLLGRFLTAEGREKMTRQVRPLGPPPPALSAGQVPTHPCRQCAAPCVTSCEPQIIRRHPQDHVLAGLAYLSFETTGCTFCGDCVEACPAATAKSPAPAKLGLAILDRDACLAWKGVICRSCEWACTYQAITLDAGGRPRMADPACTGCGFCVGVCPNTAVQVRTIRPPAGG